jgi:hypothetical protein
LTTLSNKPSVIFCNNCLSLSKPGRRTEARTPTTGKESCDAATKIHHRAERDLRKQTDALRESSVEIINDSKEAIARAKQVIDDIKQNRTGWSNGSVE